MSKQNDVGTPSGARKAALLLLSLGKEEAARVMSHLDDKMIEEIVLEMSQIRVVSKDQKEGILNEFKDTISKISIASRGGLETAKEILSNSLGQHRADEILGRITKKDIDKDFEFLNEMEPSALSGLLGLEAPQTIAVALAFIQPKKAAEVMKFFPTDIQSKIALKLAVTSRTHPDAI
ncbi:MAG: flagellar motor switch protein FliG, partial [Leptospira sp.]|nr:flagellar motor switch protein FliG [Leptospira sp.]